MREDDQELNENHFEAVAENYGQLVVTYDQRRRFIRAEQCHIGEMEALRKSKGANCQSSRRFLHNWTNGYALYLVLSRYGTSYWHAATVLVMMLLCFSWLFLFTGFRYGNQESAIINYNWGGVRRFSKCYVIFGSRLYQRCRL
jgi:hypothetical protein